MPLVYQKRKSARRTKNRPSHQATAMTPEKITLTLSGAQLEFTPIVSKPSNGDILDINDILTPLFLDIPYNNYKDGKRHHTLWGIIATDTD